MLGIVFFSHESLFICLYMSICLSIDTLFLLTASLKLERVNRGQCLNFNIAKCQHNFNRLYKFANGLVFMFIS